MNYNYLGKGLSLFPLLNASGELNVVSGARQISSQIVHLLLMRPGDNPIHPDMGHAPDIFDPTSTQEAMFWQYESQQHILKWVGHLVDWVRVEVGENPDLENKLIARVKFMPKGDRAEYSLVFGWHEYAGARRSGGSAQEMERFRDSIRLSGMPLFPNFRTQ